MELTLAEQKKFTLAGSTKTSPWWDNKRLPLAEYHHHHHPSLNREGRWGTTDNFATSFLHFSPFSTALWDLPNSRPVHSLMLSSHLFLCLLVFSPFSLCLASTTSSGSGIFCSADRVLLCAWLPKERLMTPRTRAAQVLCFINPQDDSGRDNSENPQLFDVLFLKLGAGKNTALHASPIIGNSVTPMSSFPVHSTSFPP